MIREGITRLLLPAVRNTAQKRSQSVVAGPPRNHVSTGERIILGGGMCISLLIIPAWVAVHIREYRGVKK